MSLLDAKYHLSDVLEVIARSDDKHDWPNQPFCADCGFEHPCPVERARAYMEEMDA